MKVKEEKNKTMHMLVLLGLKELVDAPWRMVIWLCICSSIIVWCRLACFEIDLGCMPLYHMSMLTHPCVHVCDVEMWCLWLYQCPRWLGRRHDKRVVERERL